MVELFEDTPLRRWLETQSRDVNLAIAARATLRSAPYFATLLARKAEGPIPEDMRAEIVLPIFRSVAAASAAARYPHRTRELHAANRDCLHFGLMAGDKAYKLGSAVRLGKALNSGYHGRAGAVSEIAETAHAALRVDLPEAKDPPTHSAMFAARAAEKFGISPSSGVSDAERSALKAATASDAEQLRNGMSPTELAGIRLWLGGEPAWSANMWRALCASLPPEEYWTVWTGWWEGRRDGLALCEEFEMELALGIDNQNRLSMWDKYVEKRYGLGVRMPRKGPFWKMTVADINRAFLDREKRRYQAKAAGTIFDSRIQSVNELFREARFNINELEDYIGHSTLVGHNRPPNSENSKHDDLSDREELLKILSDLSEAVRSLANSLNRGDAQPALGQQIDKLESARDYLKWFIERLSKAVDKALGVVIAVGVSGAIAGGVFGQDVLQRGLVILEIVDRAISSIYELLSLLFVS